MILDPCPYMYDDPWSWWMCVWCTYVCCMYVIWSLILDPDPCMYDVAEILFRTDKAILGVGYHVEIENRYASKEDFSCHTLVRWCASILFPLGWSPWVGSTPSIPVKSSSRTEILRPLRNSMVPFHRGTILSWPNLVSHLQQMHLRSFPAFYLLTWWPFLPLKTPGVDLPGSSPLNCCSIEVPFCPGWPCPIICNRCIIYVSFLFIALPYVHWRHPTLLARPLTAGHQCPSVVLAGILSRRKLPCSASLLQHCC